MKVKREYVHFQESWYAQHIRPNSDVADDIAIEVYDEDELLIGEFRIAWVKLGNDTAMQLQVFDDGFNAFSHCLDLMDLLHLMKTTDKRFEFTPEYVCGILDDLDFENSSPKTNPQERS